MTRYSFSVKAIARRMQATATAIPKWINLVRAISSEGCGRIRYHATIRRLLDSDTSVRAYLEGETAKLPAFYLNRIRQDLGPMYEYLPEGALDHDPNAYLSATDTSLPTAIQSLTARTVQA